MSINDNDYLAFYIATGNPKQHGIFRNKKLNLTYQVVYVVHDDDCYLEVRDLSSPPENSDLIKLILTDVAEDREASIDQINEAKALAISRKTPTIRMM